MPDALGHRQKQQRLLVVAHPFTRLFSLQVSLSGPLRDHPAAGAGPTRHGDHLLSTRGRPAGTRRTGSCSPAGRDPARRGQGEWGRGKGEKAEAAGLAGLFPPLLPAAINGRRGMERAGPAALSPGSRSPAFLWGGGRGKGDGGGYNPLGTRGRGVFTRCGGVVAGARMRAGGGCEGALPWRGSRRAAWGPWRDGERRRPRESAVRPPRFPARLPRRTRRRRRCPLAWRGRRPRPNGSSWGRRPGGTDISPCKSRPCAALPPAHTPSRFPVLRRR